MSRGKDAERRRASSQTQTESTREVCHHSPSVLCWEGKRMFRTTVLLCLVAALALAAPALAAEGERWARVGTLAHANNAFEALVAAHHGHDEAAFARAQREELALRAAMGRVQQTAHELQASAVLGADGVDAATWAHVQDRLRTMFGEESVRPHRVGVTLVFAEARDTHKVEEVMQWAEVSAVAPWLAAHKLSSIFESHKEQICTDMFARQDRSVELSVTTNPMSVAEVMTFTEELQRNLKAGTVQNDFDRLPASVREGPNAGVRRQRVVRIEVPNCATAGDVAKDAIQHRAGFWVEPRATVRTSNKWASGVTQSADIDTHAVWNSALNGTGQIVGVSDTGLDASHCFFYDPDVATPYNTISTTHRKIVTYIPYVNDEDYEGGHGSHVSGSVLGQVYNQDGDYTEVEEFNGMAFGAKIAFFDIGNQQEALSLPSDIDTGVFEPLLEAGAHIISNSWGSTLNLYDADAQQTDQFMWDHPDSLVLFAAGNSGTNGANSVGSPGTAKSTATIGCTLNAAESWESFQDDVDADKYNFNNVAYFSSQGPTKDGRLKPDVMAPGYYTTSTNANPGTDGPYHCNTLLMAGTSMATPTTAGNTALIREYFTSGFYPSGSANAADAFVPSGALLKNMLVQSADAMDNLLTQRDALEPLGTPPDNIQGYGRIELDNVLRVADSDFSLLAIGAADASSGGSYYEFTAAGQQNTFTVTTGSSTTAVLKVTVTWTDYPSSTGFRGGGEMVNVLGLTVESDSDEYTVADVENPIMQVVIDNPEPNTEYTITVSSTTILQGPQPYSLVVTGDFTA